MPDDSPDTTPAPIVLEVNLPLPDEFATFGLVERVVLPPGLIEQMAAAPALVPMVESSLRSEFARVAWSLATSLAAVLAQRSLSAEPLTHETYLAHQQRLADERKATS